MRNIIPAPNIAPKPPNASPLPIPFSPQKPTCGSASPVAPQTSRTITPAERFTAVFIQTIHPLTQDFSINGSILYERLKPHFPSGEEHRVEKINLACKKINIDDTQIHLLGWKTQLIQSVNKENLSVFILLLFHPALARTYVYLKDDCPDIFPLLVDKVLALKDSRFREALFLHTKINLDEVFRRENGYKAVVEFFGWEKLTDLRLISDFSLGDLAWETCLEAGNLDVVKKIIGYDVGYINKLVYGKRSLHRAMEYGHKEIALYLLAHPTTDILVTDEEGNTPLHIAVKYNHVECIQILLQRKEVNPNQVNKIGHTPLLNDIKYPFSSQAFAQMALRREGIQLLARDPRVTLFGDYPATQNCWAASEYLCQYLVEWNDRALILKMDKEKKNIQTKFKNEQEPPFKPLCYFLRRLVGSTPGDSTFGSKGMREEAFFTGLTLLDIDLTSFMWGENQDIAQSYLYHAASHPDIKWLEMYLLNFPDTELANEQIRIIEGKIRMGRLPNMIDREAKEELLRNYYNDRMSIRPVLREKYWIRRSESCFALTIFLSDHFFNLRVSKKEDEEKIKNTTRFFQMAKVLPMELQMLLSQVVGVTGRGKIKPWISVARTETALRRIVARGLLDQ